MVLSPNVQIAESSKRNTVVRIEIADLEMVISKIFSDCPIKLSQKESSPVSCKIFEVKSPASPSDIVSVAVLNSFVSRRLIISF